MPFDSDPMVGQTVAERYVIEECVGEGAMGRVYRARHHRLSRRFAIKLLFGDLAADPTMQTRFQREAEAASRLSHPNIVSVVDFGEHDGLLYLAMEFVEGEKLSDLIDAEAPLDQDRAMALFRQLALGLAHAHERGLVHRDFKSDNVLLVRPDDVETPKIVDFGLAVLPEASNARDRLTTAGLVMGTPAYMAPEQSTGREVDHRSDLFSLGLVMYEMLAGKLPFDGDPVNLARQNAMATPPSISARSPEVEVDPRLERIIFTLMAKEPDDRYESAQEVVAAIDQLWDEPVGARRRGSTGAARRPISTGTAAGLAPTVAAPTQPVSTPGKRRWSLIAGIATLLLALGAIALLLATRAEDANREEPRSARADQVVLSERTVESTATGASIDGGSSPVALPADAGAALDPGAATGDAAPEVKPETVETKKPPRKRPKRKPDSKDREVTVDAFRSAYKSVGAMVDRLEREMGAAAAAPLRKQYLSIPYLDALRVPSLRNDAYAKLKRIRSGAKRALTK